MKKLDLRPQDCLVVISNSGRNPLGIEMAELAQKRGVKTIVVTALEVSKAGTSRRSDGKLLYEFGDVVLDNKSSFGRCLHRGRGSRHQGGRHLALHRLHAA